MHGCEVLAALLMGACTAGNATARDSRADFRVTVRAMLLP